MTIQKNEDSHIGDLAKMIGLGSLLPPDNEYQMEEMGSSGSVRKEKLSNVTYFQNPEARIDANLLLIGDSFRTNMVPTLSYYFQNVYVVHRDSFESSELDRIEPDYLIIEYVERKSEDIKNLNTLLSYKFLTEEDSTSNSRLD